LRERRLSPQNSIPLADAFSNTFHNDQPNPGQGFVQPVLREAEPLPAKPVRVGNISRAVGNSCLSMSANRR
jgi:hypothetical protein